MTRLQLTGALAAGLVGTTLVVSAAPAQRLAPPPGWRWVLDSPATLADQPVNPLLAPDTLWRFVALPTGWQVTTGPGVLLFPADQPADTAYTLETTLEVLPNSSDDEFGFVLEGSAADSSYTAFLLRPDGTYAVVQRRDTAQTFLIPWSHHQSVASERRGNPLVRNLMRLRMTRSAVSFAVNGVEIATLPRGSLTASGRVGLRFGHDLDVRVSGLNLTYQLMAPGR